MLSAEIIQNLDGNGRKDRQSLCCCNWSPLTLLLSKVSAIWFQIIKPQILHFVILFVPIVKSHYFECAMSIEIWKLMISKCDISFVSFKKIQTHLFQTQWCALLIICFSFFLMRQIILFVIFVEWYVMLCLNINSFSRYFIIR